MNLPRNVEHSRQLFALKLRAHSAKSEAVQYLFDHLFITMAQQFSNFATRQQTWRAKKKAKPQSAVHFNQTLTHIFPD